LADPDGSIVDPNDRWLIIGTFALLDRFAELSEVISTMTMAVTVTVTITVTVAVTGK